MKKNLSISIAQPNRGYWDFSHLLDAPAGKHGFVEVRDGHFFFEDGTRARFIGFNIAARSNMPDHETAELVAARFASMGVNVIRLHAADNIITDGPTDWSCSKEAPLLDYESGTSRKFHPEGLDRFDYLFAALKKRGIYLHIDTLVARSFVPGDGLDYSGAFPSTAKCYPTMNKRLIELEQEYDRTFLCHVNPYTGLRMVDDPAVVTVQISNEESFIKGTDDTNGNPELEGYRQERRDRFNEFLLMKYHTRERLAQAWTHEGVCALREDEDPARHTVEVVQGSFHQPTNDPNGPWDGPVSPARYADYMDFGLWMNRNYYRRMKDFLIGLGVRVPIVCSNLLGGAADVYGHMDGDLMENNSYFNHPIPPFNTGVTTCVGPTEYVSANPLMVQRGVGSAGTTLLSFGAVAAVRGKPFMLSEWNEYGLHPFHSTSIVQTVAYACLNDWDGLIVYNHHTAGRIEDEPADQVLSVFDCYNDPSMICQWGFMASMFLKGLVSTARTSFDMVYTQNDLRSLPPFHAMTTTFLPYIGQYRNVFLDGGETYTGGADVAVNAGFLDIGDLRQAKHGVWYAWSPYRDALRRSRDGNRLARAARGTEEIEPGVHLGDRALVIDNIGEVSCGGDYRRAADLFDRAMKAWGVLPEGTGLVDGKLISDTGEIEFDPDHARFTIRTPACSFFSGAPTGELELTGRIAARFQNERISVSVLPAAGGDLESAKEFLITAMGPTGTDGQSFTSVAEMYGLTVNMVRFDGKLCADTAEGELLVKAASARLEVLDPVGEVIGAVEGELSGEWTRIPMPSELPGIQFRLTIA